MKECYLSCAINPFAPSFFLFLYPLFVSQVSLFVHSHRTSAERSIFIDRPLSFVPHCSLCYIVPLFPLFFCVKYIPVLFCMRKVLFSPFFFRTHKHASSIRTQPRWGMRKICMRATIVLSHSPLRASFPERSFPQHLPLTTTFPAYRIFRVCFLSWFSLVHG